MIKKDINEIKAIAENKSVCDPRTPIHETRNILGHFLFHGHLQTHKLVKHS